MAILALIVIVVGLVLVLLGAIITAVDWRDERAKRSAKQGAHPGLESKELGLADTLTALQKLVAELAKHPVGIRLIVLGVVLVLIGGVLGGVSGLVA